MRPRQVPVAHVHDDRRQTEHDEQPGARPARAQQGDQRAESEDEHAAGQVLNDVMLERAERHLAARGFLLDARAGAHGQVADVAAPSAHVRPTRGPKRDSSSVSERLPALASAASDSGVAKSSGLSRIMYAASVWYISDSTST